MERFFKDPKTLARLRTGPLGAWLESYAVELEAQQYARQTGRVQIRLVAAFSRWLDQKGVATREVTPQHARRYLQHRTRQGLRPRGDDTAALERLLNLLRKRRIITAPPKAVIATPAARMQRDFDVYLQHERALAPATRSYYRSFAGRFLAERFATGPVDLSRLRAVDVTAFVRRHAPCLEGKRAQLMTTALRSFLRFALQRGDIGTDLSACVPSVASWSLSTLPRYLAPGQVERVLAHCNQQTAAGRRDFAILLLLARLGLRAGEVVALKLEDIDWIAGQLTVHGKGGRVTDLPLPADVGHAIASYLQDGRPRGTSSRCVFMRGLAPATGFIGPQAVGSIVKHALARAGVDSAHKGSHLFRHTLATQMLRQGASLAEIGELLRHRSPRTTAIYAKVDLASLRMLAVPWPGGAR